MLLGRTSPKDFCFQHQKLSEIISNGIKKYRRLIFGDASVAHSLILFEKGALVWTAQFCYPSVDVLVFSLYILTRPGFTRHSKRTDFAVCRIFLYQVYRDRYSQYRRD